MFGSTTIRVVARVRGLRALLALLMLGVGFTVLAVPSAEADEGTLLRQFTADVPPCSVSTGIAFDGERLFLSCWSSGNLYAISPKDGSRLATISVAGMSGIGALAWDGARQQLWACDSGPQAVHLITFRGLDTATPTAAAEQRFTPTGGCIDGLAYDGTDDSLYASGDVRRTIYHYDSGGTLLDTRDVSTSLGGCGSSGIATGGGDLFLANNGCQQIFRVEKTQNAVPQLFVTLPRRIEDMECDDRTFTAPDGSSIPAIWVQDAYDAEIHAFEIGEGDCGFGGLPPDDQFVSVALGDSYQSGEGVGNSIEDDATYLTQAYESGSNYPEQVGTQEDTYTTSVSATGNSCHRALENYAKLNRTRLELNTDTVLIDETCSGATIEPHGGSTIVGSEGAESFDPGSQVAQALERLEVNGLAAEDVDLVTVGMGGNDAEFGKLVRACLIPSLVQRLIEAYPNTPGDLAFAGDHLNCWLLSQFENFSVDAAIEALGAKEFWAQEELLEAFPNARILQLTYPSILPENDDVPEWCGGIQRTDLDFTRRQAARINEQVITFAAQNDRFEFVRVDDAFGSNPLCPGDEAQQLANGLSAENVDREITRLLNLDGNGDAEARRLLDVAIDEYVEYRECIVDWPAHGFTCDRGALDTAVGDLFSHMTADVDQIMANLIRPGATGDERNVALDRTRGLFHPNARGFEIMACYVRSAFHEEASPAGCQDNPDRQPPTVNGILFDYFPFDLDDLGDTPTYEIPGFAPNTPVHITYYSEAVDLGTVTSDANGTVRTELTIPNAGPGVHRLQFQGTGAGGVERVVEARVNAPGDPIPGTTFGTYLCCFTGALDETKPVEEVEVSYAGYQAVLLPDAQGGILLDVVVPRRTGEFELVVEAVSRLTGQRVTKQLVEGPTISEWAVEVTVPPSANAANAGRAIPIDFRILDGLGQPMADPQRVRLRSAEVDCDSMVAESEAIPTDPAGQSELRYRDSGWWKYTWKTDPEWQGTCRELVVEIDQGTTERLLFDFR